MVLDMIRQSDLERASDNAGLVHSNSQHAPGHYSGMLFEAGSAGFAHREANRMLLRRSILLLSFLKDPCVGCEGQTMLMTSARLGGFALRADCIRAFFGYPASMFSFLFPA